MLESNFNIFLDLPGSCGKKKVKPRKNLIDEMWSHIGATVASFECWKF